jgi:hypothetical protein
MLPQPAALRGWLVWWAGWGVHSWW